MVDLTDVKNIVIKFGGSLLYDKQGELRTDQFTKLSSLVVRLREMNIKVSIVIGGGKPTRNLVMSLQPLNMTAAELDQISIQMTQIHANILNSVLGRLITTNVITKYEELLLQNHIGIVNIISGLFPGQSTNAVAALVSEITRADLMVNYFGFDKIHSSDPTREDDTIPVDQLSYENLAELISKFRQEPGFYELFDQNALNFVRRSSIPVIFLNGNAIDQIFVYLSGRNVGTMVSNERPTLSTSVEE